MKRQERLVEKHVRLSGYASGCVDGVKKSSEKARRRLGEAERLIRQTIAREREMKDDPPISRGEILVWSVSAEPEKESPSGKAAESVSSAEGKARQRPGSQGPEETEPKALDKRRERG